MNFNQQNPFLPFFFGVVFSSGTGSFSTSSFFTAVNLYCNIKTKKMLRDKTARHMYCVQVKARNYLEIFRIRGGRYFPRGRPIGYIGKFATLEFRQYFSHFNTNF